MEHYRVNRSLLETYMSCQQKYEYRNQGLELANAESKRYYDIGSCVHYVIARWSLALGQKPISYFVDKYVSTESKILWNELERVKIIEILKGFIAENYQHILLEDEGAARRVYPEVKLTFSKMIRHSRFDFEGTLDGLGTNENINYFNEFKTSSSNRHFNDHFYIKNNFQTRAYIALATENGFMPSLLNYFTIQIPKEGAALKEIKFHREPVEITKQFALECCDWLSSCLMNFGSNILDKKTMLMNFNNCYAFYGMACQYTALCASCDKEDTIKSFYSYNTEKIHDHALYEIVDCQLKPTEKLLKEMENAKNV